MKQFCYLDCKKSYERDSVTLNSAVIILITISIFSVRIQDLWEMRKWFPTNMLLGSRLHVFEQGWCSV